MWNVIHTGKAWRRHFLCELVAASNRYSLPCLSVVKEIARKKTCRKQSETSSSQVRVQIRTQSGPCLTALSLFKSSSYLRTDFGRFNRPQDQGSKWIIANFVHHFRYIYVYIYIYIYKKRNERVFRLLPAPNIFRLRVPAMYVSMCVCVCVCVRVCVCVHQQNFTQRNINGASVLWVGHYHSISYWLHPLRFRQILYFQFLSPTQTRDLSTI